MISYEETWQIGSKKNPKVDLPWDFLFCIIWLIDVHDRLQLIHPHQFYESLF